MNDVFQSLISPALVSGSIVWLSKNWISERIKHSIKNEYEEKLETHKAKLKAEQDVAVERMRSALQLAAVEHEIRYSKLHEKMAETIAETYERLQQFVDSVHDYTRPMELPGDPSKAERRKVVGEVLKNFRAFYRPRKIFLPRKTAERIGAFEDKLYRTTMEFAFKVEGGKSIDEWSKTLESLASEAAPLFQSLEDEFRRLLGVIEREEAIR